MHILPCVRLPLFALALLNCSCAGLAAHDHSDATAQAKESRVDAARIAEPRANAGPSARPAIGPRTVVLGASVKGVPITMHLFGGGPDVTFVFAGIHGDEATAAFVGRKLLGNFLASPEMPPGQALALIPIANPDGVAAGTRTNANGVDCNRNFPASNWRRSRAAGMRSNPGVRPASEPETLAVMRAIEITRPSRIISIHSGLRCNNYDGPGADLANLLARHNGYPVQASVGYPTPGSFGSWAGTDLGIPVVTLEMPRHNNGEKAWGENRAGLLAAIRSPRTGARGSER